MNRPKVRNNHPPETVVLVYAMPGDVSEQAGSGH